MNSYIDIFFNSIPSNGDVLIIQDSYTPASQIELFYGTNINIGSTIEDVVYTTYLYLQINVNSSNRYEVLVSYVPGNEQIRIVDNIGSSQFSVTENNTSGKITTSTSNEPTVTFINITDLTIQENSALPCSSLDITITTNVQGSSITSPIPTPITSNPFTLIDVNRDSVNDIDVTVELNGVNTSTRSIFVPVLSPSFFSVETVSSPSGGTVNISNNYIKTPFFNLSYSIDNVNYYSSSSFSNLNVGSYTLYIKDSIGCSITIPFSVDSFQPNTYEREPYFEVSEQNSLISVKREITDNINTFKNLTNTLSYEEETDINNRNFTQLFQTTDGVITQQFKSNFENSTVKIIDCSNNESILVTEKKTDNINVTDLRDATVIKVNYNGAEFAGVKYVQGNTYDPLTLVKKGEYYLKNSIPDFMNVDDYLSFGSTWFKVIDIVIVNNIQVLVLDVLASNFIFDITNQVVKVESVYNILPYDVFEFSFDVNNLNGSYYITYEVTDSEFETLKEQTEWFEVSEEQVNTCVLQYYNSVNNETNYSTGIRNKIRIPCETGVSYGVSNEQDIYITDTNVVQIEGSFRDLISIDIDNVPLGLVRKIGLATTNDRLFINGLSVIREGEIEPERIGVTNEYTFTLSFNRSDYVFNSINQDSSVVLPSGQPLASSDEVNGLLFIKD